VKPYFSDDKVTLYHGDCLDVLPTLSGVACIVTSPPYNTLGTRVPANPTGMHAGSAWASKVATAGYDDDLSEAEYAEWQVEVARVLAGSVKPGGSLFYNHKVRYRDGEPVHPLDLVRSFDGWRLRQEIVWARGIGTAFNARMFCPSDERIYWLVKPGADHAWNQSSAGQMTVWRITPEVGIVGHPCPFPVGLPARCIEATTAPGDVVLDPFAGSGSTLRAALDSGRRAIGIEKREDYCALIVARLAQGAFDFGAA
jgi:site-specific DNA-methyltransferase (adenine-specific)